MKITRRQLRKIIAEEIAVVKKDKIADVVLDVLADEGGAAGLEPIEDALKDLEDEEIELPDEPVEDLVSAVPGVKRHADGDYIETTKLESVMRISESRLRRIIREAMAGDQLQLPLPSDPRKIEMIEDMADFLMRGDSAIIGAIEGYDSMSAEELSDFLEGIYSTAAESMTFQERYGNQRDDAMRAYVADQLGI